MSLYDKIGENYNKTRKADRFITNALDKYFVQSNKKSCTVLDVGCGTGNYAVELARKGFALYAIDPSTKMLENAKSKKSNVIWLQAYAEELPFIDFKFDGIIAVLTVHHWTSLQKGFSEICRVMKPLSKFVLFTSTQEQMKGYWLNYYFPNLMLDSILKMPSRKDILTVAEKSGMRLINEDRYFVKDDLEDLFLYSGKNQPELYYSPEFRNGISSFTSIANREEIEQGIKRLKVDILKDNFKNVKNGFENTVGDYCFFVFQK